MAGSAVTTFRGRAEQLAGEPEHRGRWPAVLARAVAALPELVELSFPLLAPGGVLIAWKQGDVSAEATAAARAMDALGGGTLQITDVPRHPARRASAGGHHQDGHHARPLPARSRRAPQDPVVTGNRCYPSPGCGSLSSRTSTPTSSPSTPCSPHLGAVDAIWQLGDVVGYGPDPDGVVDRLARDRRGRRPGQPRRCGRRRHRRSSAFNADARARHRVDARRDLDHDANVADGTARAALEGDFTLVHG